MEEGITTQLETGQYHFLKRYFQQFFHRYLIGHLYQYSKICLPTFCRYFNKVFWLKLVGIDYSPNLRQPN